MRTQSPDTSPEAEKVLIDLWRKASTARKFRMIEDNQRSVLALSLSGLRMRHPHESEQRLRRRLADLVLGPEMAAKVYGPLD